jgi:hypothetical protein
MTHAWAQAPWHKRPVKGRGNRQTIVRATLIKSNTKKISPQTSQTTRTLYVFGFVRGVHAVRG